MAGRTDRRLQDGITLIELLVVIAIMSVVTAMIIGVWMSLNDSYAYTTTSSHAREYARDAVTRMAREIRDVANGPGGADAFRPGVCGPDSITFYSLFNKPGAGTVDATPRLVQFYLSESKLYRRVDSNNDDKLDTSDRVNVLCTNVVNHIDGNAKDVFAYTVIGPKGQRTSVPTPTDPAAIVGVDIRLLVDLNPGKSPVLMDLTTTAQPRNLRQN